MFDVNICSTHFLSDGLTAQSEIIILVKVPGDDWKVLLQSPDAKIWLPKGIQKYFATYHRLKDEVIELISKQHFKHFKFLLMNDWKSIKELHWNFSISFL